jgi:hypothetical protein
MTAIVVAAAQALHLTGDRLPRDVAPGRCRVLFLPEPVYYRRAAKWDFMPSYGRSPIRR